MIQISQGHANAYDLGVAIDGARACADVAREEIGTMMHANVKRIEDIQHLLGAVEILLMVASAHADGLTDNGRAT